MLTPISYIFNCTCGRCHKFESLMPEEFSCKCGKTYKSKTATIKEGLLQGFKTIRFTEVTQEMAEPKGVKPMIKVNRKPVDKDMLVMSAINEYNKRKSTYKDEPVESQIHRLLFSIKSILMDEKEGEVESIEITIEPTQIKSPLFTGPDTVKLTLEQCKEIAKAIQ